MLLPAENPPVAFYITYNKVKLPLAFKALCDLTQAGPMFNQSPCSLPGPQHFPSTLIFPQTCQLFLPWNLCTSPFPAPSPAAKICMSGSFLLVDSWLKCHLLREDFLVYTLKKPH